MTKYAVHIARLDHLKDSPFSQALLGMLFAIVLQVVLTYDGMDPKNAALAIGSIALAFATFRAVILWIAQAPCLERARTTLVLLLGFGICALPYLPLQVVPVILFGLACVAQNIMLQILRESEYYFAPSAVLGYGFALLAGTWYIRTAAPNFSTLEQIGPSISFFAAALYWGWRRARPVPKGRRKS